MNKKGLKLVTYSNEFMFFIEYKKYNFFLHDQDLNWGQWCYNMVEGLRHFQQSIP